MRGKIVGAALAAFVALPACADTIAVIGTGNVAGALGPEFAAQGHTIVYGSRSAGDDDVKALVARTGHGATVKGQKEAVVGATCEVVLTAYPATVNRAHDEAVGLKLLDL